MSCVVADELCPCGSGSAYPRCCGPLHAGTRTADTAEALMRSRYSAFARGDTGYVHDTWDPVTRPVDLALDPTLRWTRLRVLDVVDGGPDDDTGEVEFRAHFRRGDEPDALHERSTFRRRGTRWVYVSGQTD